MKIAVISVTTSGDCIAEKLQKFLNTTTYLKDEVKEKGIKVITESAMQNYEGLIFISSTGIAVRAIAEYIKSKDKDPAVLVIDSLGNFVISLLSGHLGGANELTVKVAEFLKSTPVITTATDNLNVTAPDIIAKDNKLVIDSFKNAKDAAAALVDGKKVAFIDEKFFIETPKGYIDNLEEAQYVVYVTNKEQLKLNPPFLKLIRKDIVLGIGCRKEFDADKMKETVETVLSQCNIHKKAVKAIATVEVKRHEKAIIELSKNLQCELKIFSIEDIKKVQHKYEGSSFVEKTIGVTSVCEPCVDLYGAKILKGKIKLNGMTLCIGEL